MSRSVRYAIGVVLVLLLVGGGGGLAVAHWNQKEPSVDGDAVARGSACVVGELREVVGDVAGLLSPDRDGERDRDEPGRRETGGATGNTPLDTLVAPVRTFLDSLGDGVPRLDEGASGSDRGC